MTAPTLHFLLLGTTNSVRTPRYAWPLSRRLAFGLSTGPYSLAACLLLVKPLVIFGAHSVSAWAAPVSP